MPRVGISKIQAGSVIVVSVEKSDLHQPTITIAGRVIGTTGGHQRHSGGWVRCRSPKGFIRSRDRLEEEDSASSGEAAGLPSSARLRMPRTSEAVVSEAIVDDDDDTEGIRRMWMAGCRERRRERCRSGIKQICCMVCVADVLFFTVGVGKEG
jgi:hypothetical protein